MSTVSGSGSSDTPNPPIVVENEEVTAAAVEANRRCGNAFDAIYAEAFVRIAIDVINRGRRSPPTPAGPLTLEQLPRRTHREALG